MRIRPTAIIFDYGNVLSQAQAMSDADAMASILKIPPSKFRETYWRFRLSYDEGAVDAQAYWSEVAKILSRGLTVGEIQTLIELDARSWSNPAPVVPAWADQLHSAGLRTALLSNMPLAVKEYVQRCSWLPEFDQWVFSCDVGMVKPKPEIYLYCLDKLGVAPREALMLDDRPENVQAAIEIGMHGIVFASLREAAEEVASRFDIPVPLADTLEGGDEKNH